MDHIPTDGEGAAQTTETEILRNAISVIRQAERAVERESRVVAGFSGHEAVYSSLKAIYEAEPVLDAFREERERLFTRKKIKQTKRPENSYQPIVRAFYKGTAIQGPQVTRRAQALAECRRKQIDATGLVRFIKKAGGYERLAKAFRKFKNTTDERKQDAVDLKAHAEALMTWGEWHPPERATEGHRTDLNLAVIEIRGDGAFRLGRVIPTELDSIRRRVIASVGKQ